MQLLARGAVEDDGGGLLVQHAEPRQAGTVFGDGDGLDGGPIQVGVRLLASGLVRALIFAPPTVHRSGGRGAVVDADDQRAFLVQRVALLAGILAFVVFAVHDGGAVDHVVAVGVDLVRLGDGVVGVAHLALVGDGVEAPVHDRVLVDDVVARHAGHVLVFLEVTPPRGVVACEAAAQVAFLPAVGLNAQAVANAVQRHVVACTQVGGGAEPQRIHAVAGVGRANVGLRVGRRLLPRPARRAVVRADQVGPAGVLERGVVGERELDDGVVVVQQVGHDHVVGVHDPAGHVHILQGAEVAQQVAGVIGAVAITDMAKRQAGAIEVRDVVEQLGVVVLRHGIAVVVVRVSAPIRAGNGRAEPQHHVGCVRLTGRLDGLYRLAGEVPEPGCAGILHSGVSVPIIIPAPVVVPRDVDAATRIRIELLVRAGADADPERGVRSVALVEEPVCVQVLVDGVAVNVFVAVVEVRARADRPLEGVAVFGQRVGQRVVRIVQRVAGRAVAAVDQLVGAVEPGLVVEQLDAVFGDGMPHALVLRAGGGVKARVLQHGVLAQRQLLDAGAAVEHARQVTQVGSLGYAIVVRAHVPAAEVDLLQAGDALEHVLEALGLRGVEPAAVEGDHVAVVARGDEGRNVIAVGIVDGVHVRAIRSAIAATRVARLAGVDVCVVFAIGFGDGVVEPVLQVTGLQLVLQDDVLDIARVHRGQPRQLIAVEREELAGVAGIAVVADDERATIGVDDVGALFVDEVLAGLRILRVAREARVGCGVVGAVRVLLHELPADVVALGEVVLGIPVVPGGGGDRARCARRVQRVGQRVRRAPLAPVGNGFARDAGHVALVRASEPRACVQLAAGGLVGVVDAGTLQHDVFAEAQIDELDATCQHVGDGLADHFPTGQVQHLQRACALEGRREIADDVGVPVLGAADAFKDVGAFEQAGDGCGGAVRLGGEAHLVHDGFRQRRMAHEPAFGVRQVNDVLELHLRDEVVNRGVGLGLLKLEQRVGREVLPRQRVANLGDLAAGNVVFVGRAAVADGQHAGAHVVAPPHVQVAFKRALNEADELVPVHVEVVAGVLVQAVGQEVAAVRIRRNHAFARCGVEAGPAAVVDGVRREACEARALEHGCLARLNVDEALAAVEEAGERGIFHDPGGKVHGDDVQRVLEHVGHGHGEARALVGDLPTGDGLLGGEARAVGEQVGEVPHVADVPVLKGREVGKQQRAVEHVRQHLGARHSPVPQLLEAGVGERGHVAEHAGEVLNLRHVPLADVLDVGKLLIVGEHVGDAGGDADVARSGERHVHARTVEGLEVLVAREPVGRVLQPHVALRRDVFDERIVLQLAFGQRVAYGAVLGDEAAVLVARGADLAVPRQLVGRGVGVAFGARHGDGAVGVGAVVGADGERAVRGAVRVDVERPPRAAPRRLVGLEAAAGVIGVPHVGVHRVVMLVGTQRVTAGQAQRVIPPGTARGRVLKHPAAVPRLAHEQRVVEARRRRGGAAFGKAQRGRAAGDDLGDVHAPAEEALHAGVGRGLLHVPLRDVERDERRRIRVVGELDARRGVVLQDLPLGHEVGHVEHVREVLDVGRVPRGDVGVALQAGAVLEHGLHGGDVARAARRAPLDEVGQAGVDLLAAFEHVRQVEHLVDAPVAHIGEVGKAVVVREEAVQALNALAQRRERGGGARRVQLDGAGRNLVVFSVRALEVHAAAVERDERGVTGSLAQREVLEAVAHPTVIVAGVGVPLAPVVAHVGVAETEVVRARFGHGDDIAHMVPVAGLIEPSRHVARHALVPVVAGVAVVPTPEVEVHVPATAVGIVNVFEPVVHVDDVGLALFEGYRGIAAAIPPAALRNGDSTRNGGARRCVNRDVPALRVVPRKVLVRVVVRVGREPHCRMQDVQVALRDDVADERRLDDADPRQLVVLLGHDDRVFAGQDHFGADVERATRVGRGPPAGALAVVAGLPRVGSVGLHADEVPPGTLIAFETAAEGGVVPRVQQLVAARVAAQLVQGRELRRVVEPAVAFQDPAAVARAAVVDVVVEAAADQDVVVVEQHGAQRAAVGEHVGEVDGLGSQAEAVARGAAVSCGVERAVNLVRGIPHVVAVGVFGIPAVALLAAIGVGVVRAVGRRVVGDPFAGGGFFERKRVTLARVARLVQAVGFAVLHVVAVVVLGGGQRVTDLAAIGRRHELAVLRALPVDHAAVGIGDVVAVGVGDEFLVVALLRAVGEGVELAVRHAAEHRFSDEDVYGFQGFGERQRVMLPVAVGDAGHAVRRAIVVGDVLAVVVGRGDQRVTHGRSIGRGVVFAVVGAVVVGDVLTLRSHFVAEVVACNHVDRSVVQAELPAVANGDVAVGIEHVVVIGDFVGGLGGHVVEARLRLVELCVVGAIRFAIVFGYPVAFDVRFVPDAEQLGVGAVGSDPEAELPSEVVLDGAVLVVLDVRALGRRTGHEVVADLGVVPAGNVFDVLAVDVHVLTLIVRFVAELVALDDVGGFAEGAVMVARAVGDVRAVGAHVVAVGIFGGHVVVAHGAIVGGGVVTAVRRGNVAGLGDEIAIGGLRGRDVEALEVFSFLVDLLVVHAVRVAAVVGDVRAVGVFHDSKVEAHGAVVGRGAVLAERLPVVVGDVHDVGGRFRIGVVGNVRLGVTVLRFVGAVVVLAVQRRAEHEVAVFVDDVHGHVHHIPSGQVEVVQRGAAFEHVAEVGDVEHVPLVDAGVRVGCGAAVRLQLRAACEHVRHVGEGVDVPIVHVDEVDEQRVVLEHAREAGDVGGVQVGAIEHFKALVAAEPVSRRVDVRRACEDDAVDGRGGSVEVERVDTRVREPQRLDVGARFGYVLVGAAVGADFKEALLARRGGADVEPPPGVRVAGEAAGKRRGIPHVGEHAERTVHVVLRAARAVGVTVFQRGGVAEPRHAGELPRTRVVRARAASVDTHVVSGRVLQDHLVVDDDGGQTWRLQQHVGEGLGALQELEVRAVSRLEAGEVDLVQVVAVVEHLGEVHVVGHRPRVDAGRGGERVVVVEHAREVQRVRRSAGMRAEAPRAGVVQGLQAVAVMEHLREVRSPGSIEAVAVDVGDAVVTREPVGRRERSQAVAVVVALEDDVQHVAGPSHAMTQPRQVVVGLVPAAVTVIVGGAPVVDRRLTAQRADGSVRGVVVEADVERSGRRIELPLGGDVVERIGAGPQEVAADEALFPLVPLVRVGLGGAAVAIALGQVGRAVEPRVVELLPAAVPSAAVAQGIVETAFDGFGDADVTVVVDVGVVGRHAKHDARAQVHLVQAVAVVQHVLNHGARHVGGLGGIRGRCRLGDDPSGVDAVFLHVLVLGTLGRGDLLVEGAIICGIVYGVILGVRAVNQLVLRACVVLVVCERHVLVVDAAFHQVMALFGVVGRLRIRERHGPRVNVELLQARSAAEHALEGLHVRDVPAAEVGLGQVRAVLEHVLQRNADARGQAERVAYANCEIGRVGVQLPVLDEVERFEPGGVLEHRLEGGHVADVPTDERREHRVLLGVGRSGVGGVGKAVVARSERAVRFVLHSLVARHGGRVAVRVVLPVRRAVVVGDIVAVVVLGHGVVVLHLGLEQVGGAAEHERHVRQVRRGLPVAHALDLGEVGAAVEQVAHVLDVLQRPTVDARDGLQVGAALEDARERVLGHFGQVEAACVDFEQVGVALEPILRVDEHDAALEDDLADGRRAVRDDVGPRQALGYGVAALGGGVGGRMVGRHVLDLEVAGAVGADMQDAAGGVAGVQRTLVVPPRVVDAVAIGEVAARKGTIPVVGPHGVVAVELDRGTVNDLQVRRRAAPRARRRVVMALPHAVDDCVVGEGVVQAGIVGCSPDAQVRLLAERDAQQRAAIAQQVLNREAGAHLPLRQVDRRKHRGVVAVHVEHALDGGVGALVGELADGPTRNARGVRQADAAREHVAEVLHAAGDPVRQHVERRDARVLEHALHVDDLRGVGVIGEQRPVAHAVVHRQRSAVLEEVLEVQALADIPVGKRVDFTVIGCTAEYVVAAEQRFHGGDVACLPQRQTRDLGEQRVGGEHVAEAGDARRHAHARYADRLQLRVVAEPVRREVGRYRAFCIDHVVDEGEAGVAPVAAEEVPRHAGRVFVAVLGAVREDVVRVGGGHLLFDAAGGGAVGAVQGERASRGGAVGNVVVELPPHVQVGIEAAQDDTRLERVRAGHGGSADGGNGGVVFGLQEVDGGALPGRAAGGALPRAHVGHAGGQAASVIGAAGTVRAEVLVGEHGIGAGGAHFVNVGVGVDVDLEAPTRVMRVVVRQAGNEREVDPLRTREHPRFEAVHGLPRRKRARAVHHAARRSAVPGIRFRALG